LEKTYLAVILSPPSLPFCPPFCRPFCRPAFLPPLIPASIASGLPSFLLAFLTTSHPAFLPSRLVRWVARCGSLRLSLRRVGSSTCGGSPGSQTD
jgi:hypothetical protein